MSQRNADLSRDQCLHEIFDTVVKLNKNRILGRLASKFFKRPYYERGSRRLPLTSRFKDRIMSHQPNQSRRDFETLCAEIETFHTSFLRLERSSANDIVELTKSVVIDAFPITVDGFSLPRRLEKLGVSSSMTDNREVREVSKVANYWRICHDLVSLSRSYRTLFTKLRLETLEPYSSSPTIDMKLDKYVHAEIQMVVFCENSMTPPWPRPIGASKEACYLCDSFIKAHGRFYLSKAHRQVFPQWTIPDLEEYSTETLRRFRRTLAAVAQDVTQELVRARQNHRFQFFPIQSSINLYKAVLPTPSVTTALSSGSETIRTVSPMGEYNMHGPVVREADFRSSGEAVIENVNPKDVTAWSPPKVLLPAHPAELARIPEAAASGSSLGEVDEPSRTAVSFSPSQGSSSAGTEIPLTSSFHRELDWIRCYVSLDCPSKPKDRGHDYPVMFPRASAGLKTVPYDDDIDLVYGMKYIDVGALAPGEERVLARPEVDRDDDVDPELQLVLVNSHQDPIQMVCRWHRV